MLQKWNKFFVICFSAVLLCLAVYPFGAQAAKPVVVIDPAHGGDDTGVIGLDGVTEKDIVLAIALALQKELVKDGNVEVVLTRVADKTVSNDERKKSIINAKPALVLSLHVNAGFGKASSGYELYYPGFKKDEHVSPESKKDQDQVLQNKNLNETVKLARLIQRNLDVLFPRKNRGLREAGVPLAEGLSAPVLIVEMGFATNPDEKKKLTSARTQADIARALAKSVKAFF